MSILGEFMKNIKIKSKLENLLENKVIENEYVGIIDDGNICYKDGNCDISIKLESPLKIWRKCSEYELCLEFYDKKNSYCLYNIYSVGSLNLKVYTDYIDVDNQAVFIKYSIYWQNELMGKFVYQFNYEVI